MKGDDKYLRFRPIKDTNAKGEKYTKAYKLVVGKRKLEKSGFTPDDELNVEYKRNKIIITKKKD